MLYNMHWSDLLRVPTKLVVGWNFLKSFPGNYPCPIGPSTCLLALYLEPTCFASPSLANRACSMTCPFWLLCQAAKSWIHLLYNMKSFQFAFLNHATFCFTILLLSPKRYHQCWLACGWFSPSPLVFPFLQVVVVCSWIGKHGFGVVGMVHFIRLHRSKILRMLLHCIPQAFPRHYVD